MLVDELATLVIIHMSELNTSTCLPPGLKSRASFNKCKAPASNETTARS